VTCCEYGRRSDDDHAGTDYDVIVRVVQLGIDGYDNRARWLLDDQHNVPVF
jgi:hypothetical protein